MRIDAWFIKASVIWLAVGMLMGISMAASHDFSLHPAHAHINLVGWATMALYGLIYRAWPEMAEGALPKLQFWVALAGAILMPIGIVGSIRQMAWGEPVAIAGSLLTALALLLFAWVVFTRMRTS